jgi:hypothetical protein
MFHINLQTFLGIDEISGDVMLEVNAIHGLVEGP